MSQEFEKALGQINQDIEQINSRIAEFEKAVASSDTAFPVRENLEATAKLVIPVDTPLLNRFPTRPGSGKATAWKEITDFGSPEAAAGVFYAEAGSPTGRTTTYADRSDTYKLLGMDGGVSAFAIAAGANFQDQLDIEKRNTILHLKVLEERALIIADGTGNAFSGLLTQITTGNGSEVAASTGASGLTSDLDSLLKATWDKGAELTAFVVRSSESKVLSQQITSNSNSPLRVQVDQNNRITGGFHVNAYISPITGRSVEIIPDKFLAQGTIIGLAEDLPVPIAGQGGAGIMLDVLLGYALSDVPTANDQKLFRVKRYYTFIMPGRKFCAKLTGF